MAFLLYGKVVALHLDNIVAVAYLCNQGGTECTFLSRLACHILNLADIHGIAFTPAYIPIHLNVEAEITGKVVSTVAPSSFHRLGSHPTLGSTGG